VAKNVVPLDAAVDFRMAAMAEPLACALRGIEQSDVEAGQSVAIIGAGPIGLMLLVLARLRGADVIVVGRNASRLRKARAMGACEVIDASEHADVARPLRQRGRGGQGPDVVIEAAGLAETAEAAIRAVRKGGLVNLFAGWPADARVALDALRMHYEELTVTSAFHHSPASFRAAYRLIAEGSVDPAPSLRTRPRSTRCPTCCGECQLAATGSRRRSCPGGNRKGGRVAPPPGRLESRPRTA
jgi:L-iditol 2-dehydrogenase